ncbi:tyrosinase family oxidase copper chaperone [Actinoplanes oblitus]|uniref:Tyrosinase family oxidase copper chaperone n=1 Tax=Actinoplanes oblitus TaxID=3040509 RepID=A0ABY8WNC6_9ACTN|nr:tyrosinase family oxidase copper chaperone [Actinoplanes oblitus]WIM98613.1 tyrosinase family oxidase copper chaperone [Actinoplanes oblitus]
MLKRQVANVVLAAALVPAVLTVTAPAPAGAQAPAGPATSDSVPPVGVFVEYYRDRLIHGWGGAHPCAYIDGVSLGLVDHGDNRYSSTVNAYEITVGVRATTRAAVRSLAGAELRPAEPTAYCPR